MDVVLDQSTEDLLCCRVCLLTDCKLFNIHEYKLADAFSRISGTPVFKGRLPQYLCTYCHTLLQKCAQFRLRCLQTERCLKQALLKGELNTDRILKIDRTAHQLVHLTLTEVENIDFPAKSLVDQRNVVGIREPKIERVAKDEDTDDEADTDDLHEAADYSNSDTHVDYDEILANLNVNKYKEKEPSVAVAANKDKAGIVEGNVVKVATNINTIAASVSNRDKVHRKEPSVDVAQNKDKAGMLKKCVVKVPSTINTAAANIRNGNKVQAKEPRVDVAQNKQKIGIVNGTIAKIASNIHTVAANVRNGNKVQATAPREVVAQNKVNVGSTINTVAALCFNRDKVNMPGIVNTVHADNPVSKPNLKMELEMLQGQLKITVVNDEKNIQSMEEIDTKVITNNDQVKAVMCDVRKCSPEEILLKSINRARRNKKKGAGNDTNEKKFQAIIFKSSADMLKMLGISNKDLTKIGMKYKGFDAARFERENGVKIITLSKEEQLEEIALRKQSANYLESRYKCDDCGKGFGAECTYNNHRLRHSEITGDVACEICSLRFPNKRRLRGHLLSHQFKLVCDTCGFVSRSRANARAHHAMHEGKTFVCPHCDKVFRKPSTYLSHVRIAHPAAHVACELCGETFIGERGLHAHFQLMHKHSENLKLLVQEKHNCTICSASFLSLDALNTHIDLGEHGGSPCEQCGESCASEDALQAHVEARHPREEHRCEECRMSFSSRTAFDVHYKRKHLNQRPPQHVGWPNGRPTRRTPRPPRQVMCEQCGRVLKIQSEAQLRDHMNKHLGLRPYACAECPRAFTAKYLLKAHVRRHTGERPFQCSQCPLAFAVKGNMQRHYKVVHLGEHDNAVCPTCGRVCTTRGSLRLHIRAVHQRMGWPKRNRTNERKRIRLPDDYKRTRGADGDRERSPVQRKRKRQDSLFTERREVDSDEEYSSPPTPHKWTSGAVDSDGSSTPPSPPRRRRFQL